MIRSLKPKSSSPLAVTTLERTKSKILHPERALATDLSKEICGLEGPDHRRSEALLQLSLAFSDVAGSNDSFDSSPNPAALPLRLVSRTQTSLSRRETSFLSGWISCF